MSNLLRPTNRKNECPICANTSGKCRTHKNGGLFLCMTEAGAKLHDIISGYRCVKEAGSKNWASFVVDSENPEIDREKYSKQREEARADERKRFAAGLSADERHIAHTRLLAELSLHPADESNLRERGLSAESIATYKSIGQWQALGISLPKGTPGAAGNKLRSPYIGFLVPAKDTEGRILGFQIRNRKKGEDQPKYPWLSTHGRPVNMRDGEMPLHYAPGGMGWEVNLCEGILKPQVAAERHGQAFIGAAGGNFASSENQLKAYLEKLKPQAVILCPDGEAQINPQVMNQYTKAAHLIRSWGYDFKVRWWGQFTKDGGDVDEISPEQFHEAELLSWEGYQKLSPVAASLGRTAAKKPTEQRLSIKPDIEFTEGYLGEHCELPAPSERKIILMGAQKGGGKSHAIKGHCAEQSAPTTALTYRDALASKAANELGLGYRDSTAPAGLAGCFDSFHSTSKMGYKAENHTGNILVVDEAVSVVRHGVFSPTCKAERGFIWPEIADSIRNATDPAGRGQLILADADLNDRTVNLLLSFAHPDAPEPMYIRQQPQPKQGRVWRYDDSADLIGHAVDAALSGQNIWVCASGQKSTSKKGSTALESLFIERGLPADKVLRLDSDSIKTEGHPAFKFLSLDKEAQETLLQQYRVVIATSAVEAGVSIELVNHYSAVYGIFTGVVAPSAARQALSRVRDFAIDRHVFAAPKGLPTSFIGSGETTAKDLALSQAAKTMKLREKLAGSAIRWCEDEQRPRVMNDVLAFWCEEAADHNRQMANYAESVFSGLAGEGWKVSFALAVAHPQINDELGTIRDKNHLKQCEEICYQPSVSDDEADAIEREGIYQPGDAELLRRHSLERLYATQMISPELVMADDAGSYGYLRMFYLLTIGCVFESSHLAAEVKSLKGLGGAVFSPDLDQRNLSAKRDLLKRIGIPRLLKYNTDFDKNHPDVVRVWANIRANKAQLQKLLKLDLGKAKAIGGINKVLHAAIGTRLKKHHRKKVGKKGIPVYRFEGLPFDDVVERWFDRDIQSAASRGQKIDFSPLGYVENEPSKTGENQLEIGHSSVEQSTTEKSAILTAETQATTELQPMKKGDQKSLIISFLYSGFGHLTETAFSSWEKRRETRPEKIREAAPATPELIVEEVEAPAPEPIAESPADELPDYRMPDSWYERKEITVPDTYAYGSSSSPWYIEGLDEETGQLIISNPYGAVARAELSELTPWTALVSV